MQEAIERLLNALTMGGPVDSNNEVTIREAGKHDLPSIFDVRLSVTENALTREQLSAMGITETSLARLMRRKQLHVWCATEREAAKPAPAIVGFVMVRARQHDVFALFVSPDWQGRGVGTQLLTRAVNWLRSQGSSPIRLKTGINTRAQQFYARRGWTVTETLVTDNEVIMTFKGDVDANTTT